jgi:hypothetical protein
VYIDRVGERVAFSYNFDLSFVSYVMCFHVRFRSSQLLTSHPVYAEITIKRIMIITIIIVIIIIIKTLVIKRRIIKLKSKSRNIVIMLLLFLCNQYFVVFIISIYS